MNIPSRLSWKLLLISVSVVIFAIGVFTAARAQEESDEEFVRKYNITFPIAELNNCPDVPTCKAFCDDPVNQNACIAFAKQKGFYEEVQRDPGDEAIIADAKASLGCSSEAECRAMCEQPENFEKCDAFAQRHGLGGGQGRRHEDPRILQDARETLGCDSRETCEAVCRQPENRQKCSEFAKRHGLEGGERRVGPGGCTSEETCRAFCSDPKNFDECRKFGPGPEGEQFRGPGGCDSPDSCMAYCRDHPEECRDFGPGGPPGGQFQGPGGCTSEETCRAFCETHQEECQQFGPGPDGPRGGPPAGPQTGPGGCTSEEECRAYCEQHPDECGGPGPGGPPGFDDPAERERIERLCRENPEECPFKGPSDRGGPPGEFPPPPGDFPPGPYPPDGQPPFPPPDGASMMPPGFAPPPDEFMPPEGVQPPPTQESAPPPPDSGGSSEPPPPSEPQPQPAPEQVYGASTNRNLLQLIVDFFRGLFS